MPSPNPTEFHTDDGTEELDIELPQAFWEHLFVVCHWWR
jgi:hypothetical protein